jgi:signal peptidase I
MKNLSLIVMFLAVILLSVFGIPALLESALGVEQPVLTVTSGSMWPELSRGDIVFVKKIGIEDIEVGSVIVFRHENGLAVHRVIKIEGTRITTKGDANPLADLPITYNDVIGRIPTIGSKLIKIPWVGHFSLIEETGEGTATLDNAAGSGFWQQFSEVILNPVSIAVLILTILAILFLDRIASSLGKVMPMSVRKRRLKARTRRLPERSR